MAHHHALESRYTTHAESAKERRLSSIRLLGPWASHFATVGSSVLIDIDNPPKQNHIKRDGLALGEAIESSISDIQTHPSGSRYGVLSMLLR